MPKVITIGEMLVEIMRKKTDVSLEEPADFIGPFPSGAPAIFIDAVARLGVSAGIIGAVGCDEFGECILRRLTKDGVDVSIVKRVKDISTGVAFVSYFSDGSRKFIFHMGNSAAGMIHPDEIPVEYVKGASAIHISGSSLAMCDNMRKACYKVVEIGKKAGAVISFDPNIRKELGLNKIKEMVLPILESCTLLIPTADELVWISGTENEEKAVKKMLSKGVKIIAVKDGKKGCRIYTKDQKVEAPAFEVEEIDPTGAGDAFSAAIVVGYLEKMNLKKLAFFANAVGAKAVTAKGPMEGLATRDEIKRMMSQYAIRY